MFHVGPLTNEDGSSEGCIGMKNNQNGKSQVVQHITNIGTFVAILTSNDGSSDGEMLGSSLGSLLGSSEGEELGFIEIFLDQNRVRKYKVSSKLSHKTYNCTTSYRRVKRRHPTRLFGWRPRRLIAR